MIWARVATAFSSSAFSLYCELDTKLAVRPKSVINCPTDTPPAARGNTVGSFRKPAVIRLPGSESVAVRLRYTFGRSADRCSRTNCCATNARSLPMVICGLFRSAMASACVSIKRDVDGAVCAPEEFDAGGICAAAHFPASNTDSVTARLARLMLTTQSNALLHCDG